MIGGGDIYIVYNILCLNISSIYIIKFVYEIIKLSFFSILLANEKKLLLEKIIKNIIIIYNYYYDDDEVNVEHSLCIK